MNRIIRASSLRGTVASSRMVVGFTRARALNALRLAVARRAASAASAASRTEVAPFAEQSSRILAASSATAAGCPSTSIRRRASASSGSPTCAYSSTQRIVFESRNSRVQGTILAAMMAETVSAADSIRAYIARSVWRAAGFGRSLRSTSVTTPSVPSLPMKRSLRL